jgi:hypothetical protein
MAIRGEFVVPTEMTSIPNGIRRRGLIALVVSHRSASVRPKSPDLLATPGRHAYLGTIREHILLLRRLQCSNLTFPSSIQTDRLRRSR